MNTRPDVRRLAGGLLLWSLAPYPFLYVVSPPFWLVAGVAGLWRLVRPRDSWAPSRALQNFMGVAILLAVVAAGGLAIGPLRPLGHLLLLLTAVRVAGIDGLRDLRRVLPPIFLVALVGIVSAVHVSIVPFLFVSFVVWWYVGMRVFLLELSEKTGSPLGRPKWRHAAVAATASAILAAPVFLLLPRLHSPLLGTALGRQAGFSDSMRLSGSGAIRQSGTPAAYVSMVDGSKVPLELLRLRATGFDMLTPDTWGPRRSGLVRAPMRGNLVWLDAGRLSLERTTALDIALVERGRFLFLPPGAVALQVSEPVLLDPAGGVVLAGREGLTPNYRVWVAPDSRRRLQPAEVRDLFLPKHNEQVCRLSERVAGPFDSAAAKANAVERFLEADYSYSLEGRPMGGRDPVAWFLFDGREGHCEFFAASMAVMLRHQGVQARVVAGYHGGDSLPGAETVVVRRDNAHAWVEVWLDSERKWAVFDPTPAEGIDGLVSMGAWERLKSAWQGVEDFFDRRVLTFSLSEQMGIFTAVLNGFDAGRRWIFALSLWSVALPAMLLFLLWAALRFRGFSLGGSRRSPAARAVDRLGRGLRRAGLEMPVAVTLAWIGREAARRWPNAAGEIRRLAVLAQDEMYGPPESEPSSSPAEIRRLWTRVRKAMA
ncbi:MAG: DUF3488 and transglutaminase-like domain-containing protein [Thermoanaerobaculales bacterium]|nr:DUF3488 and transglutaminase-like domain-containing protein [Thermoanaerobaculales bacterium]